MHGTIPAKPQRCGPVPLPPSPRAAPRPARAARRAPGLRHLPRLHRVGRGGDRGRLASSRSLTDGIGREGRRILGGDMAFSLLQREANAQERAFLASKGQVNTIVPCAPWCWRATRARPWWAEGGRFDLSHRGRPRVRSAHESGGPAGRAQRRLRGGGRSALLARLDLKVGERVKVGDATVELRASLVSEPDKIASAGFGPRLLVSEAAVRATGLIQPGSLVRWTTGSSCHPPSPPRRAWPRSRAEAGRELPEAGWNVRNRLSTDQRFARNIERFTQFLTLVGLTALLVGGVGVANAVRGFVDRKRASIATSRAWALRAGRWFCSISRR